MHAARLVTGEDVVVKVQKPGVAETLSADLGFLEVAAMALEFIAPDLSRFSVANIVQDLRTSMLGELDFNAVQVCVRDGRLSSSRVAVPTHASRQEPVQHLSAQRRGTQSHPRLDG